MKNNNQVNNAVEINNGSLRYLLSEQSIFNDLNMCIEKGKWTAILGKSGCGKTTLMRYLAGLLSDHVIWTGKLCIEGSESFNHHNLAGNIAYMAQQDLLMPWLNVIDNICFAEKFNANTNTNTNAIATCQLSRQRAHELLTLVGLEEHALTMPSQLSGGMRQRVALARTLMQDKPFVLMDEPFSAVDAVTRHRLQTLASTLLQNKTIILITHDPQEALRLSDAIYILQGTPAQATALSLPLTQTPRSFDAQLATLQQQIIEMLEVDYV